MQACVGHVRGCGGTGRPERQCCELYVPAGFWRNAHTGARETWDASCVCMNMCVSAALECCECVRSCIHSCRTSCLWDCCGFVHGAHAVPVYMGVELRSWMTHSGMCHGKRASGSEFCVNACIHACALERTQARMRTVWMHAFMHVVERTQAGMRSACIQAFISRMRSAYIHAFMRVARVQATGERGAGVQPSSRTVRMSGCCGGPGTPGPLRHSSCAPRVRSDHAHTKQHVGSSRPSRPVILGFLRPIRYVTGPGARPSRAAPE